jgi:thioesterase domain-containing protein
MVTMHQRIRDAQVLEAYMQSSAHLVPHLGLSVASLSPLSLTLAAQLYPNLNHKGMAFGGSLHAIATLSCWAFLSSYVGTLDEGVSILISRSEVDYLLPVTSDFSVTCARADEKAWEIFLRTYTQRGKARIELGADIVRASGESALKYRGSFVAKNKGRSVGIT